MLRSISMRTVRLFQKVSSTNTILLARRRYQYQQDQARGNGSTMYSRFLKATILFLSTISSVNAFAHPGRTDSNGCHNNRKTGEYHCHGGSGNSKPDAPALPPHANGRTELAPQNQGSFNCSGKTKCGEMRNCQEAKFYLYNCGLSRLDGDGDGVPCESLCGG